MALVPEAGVLIAARYRLLRKVGAGGMGEVWAAQDERTARVVALKLVRGGGDDAAARQGLIREARAAQAFHHPHALHVQEVLDVDGEPLLVMELLEGETLAARLRCEPRMDVAEIVAVALPVVSALGAAHAAGLVHRDLKPENIFLDVRSGGRLVRVLDFGIARRSLIDAEAAQISGLTTTGLVVGTPAYMSPEQLYGESDLDHRADLWSLGVVLYQCLAGFLPTAGDNLGQVIKAIVARPFQPLAALRPDVPQALVKLVERLLARSRSARPRDAAEVFEALRALDPKAAVGLPTPPRLLVPVRITSENATLRVTQERVVPRRGARRYLVPAALIAAAAGVALAAGFARHRADAPLPMGAAAGPPVACPPWRVLSGEADRWLGAAAAATACERLRVLLGGAAGRTLSPAELLDLPARPFDRDYGSALETEAGRQAALASARSRGAAILDGEVAFEPGRFRVRLGAEGDGSARFFSGPSLYAAVALAQDDAEARGLLRRAASLDPAWAEWSRARDIGGALALLDLVFAIAENAQALDLACRAVDAHAGIDEAMKQVARWHCAYTRGVEAPAPRFKAASPGEVALLARAVHSAARSDPPQTIAALEALLAKEPTALGRSTLAASLSCLAQAGDSRAAGRYARLAVQHDPRNLLGEFCAPWGQVLVTTTDENRTAAARAMQAWAPWDSTGWQWQAMGPGDPARALRDARRAWQLSPLDTNVADVFVDRLLASKLPEEARTVALALSAGPDPVHRLASEVIQVRLDSIEGLFARAEGRAMRGLKAASDADSGWVRVQRLDLAVRAVELAEVLGTEQEVADEVALRLVLRDPPLLDGTYVTVAANIPAVCARCSRPVARRCFARFARLKEKLSGGIVGGTDAFAEGARLWAEGDRAAAASAFRPLLREPDLYVALLPLAMVQSFSLAGDEEAARRLAEKAEAQAPRFHGALPLHLFLARRAERTDPPRACALATRLVQAWSAADARVPAAFAASAIAARACPRRP